MQHPFMIKNFLKVGIVGTYLNIVRLFMMYRNRLHCFTLTTKYQKGDIKKIPIKIVPLKIKYLGNKLDQASERMIC